MLAWSWISVFSDQQDIHDLVHARAWFVDQLLQHAWSLQSCPQGGCKLALVAVGGYGRAELHPHSDIDLLILLENEEHHYLHEQISSFLTLLWDIGLEVGHSVRTVQQCADEARNDLTVMTNLLESRLLWGEMPLLEAMREQTVHNTCGQASSFLSEKLPSSVSATTNTTTPNTT